MVNAQYWLNEQMIPKYFKYMILSGPILLRAQGLQTHSAFQTATKLSRAQFTIWWLLWGVAFSFFPSAGGCAFSPLTTKSNLLLTNLLLVYMSSQCSVLFSLELQILPISTFFK